MGPHGSGFFSDACTCTGCYRENNVLNKLVLPAVSSLRSAMARNALLCVQELILGLKIETIAYFGAVVPVLLNRACSEKQFLKDLARDVLDTALQAGADEELLNPLLATSTTEKNAQIISVVRDGRKLFFSKKSWIVA